MPRNVTIPALKNRKMNNHPGSPPAGSARTTNDKPGMWWIGVQYELGSQAGIDGRVAMAPRSCIVRPTQHTPESVLTCSHWYRSALCALVLALVACGGGNSSSDDDDGADVGVDSSDGDVGTDTNPGDTGGEDVGDDSDTSDDVADASDATDAADTTDATDATDTTDTADATDATDATDTTDARDATDVMDATDASDASDTTDGGDDTDVACPDQDMDTVCDTDDVCDGFDDLADGDMDGVPDGCDVCDAGDDNADADMDTVPDACDICDAGDDLVDTDMDLVPDACDTCPMDNPDDTDMDGVCDSDDPCPLDNPDDTDMDTVCDSDDVCAGGDDRIDMDMNMIPDACDNMMPRAPAAAGELVVTEFLKNPSGDDTLGEWFELFNATSDPLLLDTVVISDDGGNTHTIDSDGVAVVMPGDYFVLGNNADTMTNGGVTVDYEYAGFTLGNGSDEIIVTAGMTEIDRVEYSDAAYPDVSGSAAQFDGDADASADDNNDGSFWCNATELIGGVGPDLGTPGSANTSCNTPATIVTIPQIQDDTAMGHPAPGTRVQVIGVVTAVSTDGEHIFLQDAMATTHGGLYVSDSGTLLGATASRGDVVEVTGTYTESQGGNLATVALESFTSMGTDTVPAPTVLTPADILDDGIAELYESMLVELQNVTVTSANPDDPAGDFGEFEVDGVRVDDLLYEVTPDPVLDDTFSTVVGPLNYTFGNFKIVPRDAADVVAGLTAFTESEVQQLFNDNCSGCHIGGSSGGMNLDDFTMTAINVPSNQAAGVDRIEPGDPDNSYILQKLLGTQASVGGTGSRMPLGRAPLSDDDLTRLELYIRGL